MGIFTIDGLFQIIDKYIEMKKGSYRKQKNIKEIITQFIM